MVYQLDLDHCYDFVMLLTIESGKVLKKKIIYNIYFNSQFYIFNFLDNKRSDSRRQKY